MALNSVLMSWPEGMDMLWIKFLSFVSVFCSVNLSCSLIVHIFKDKHQVAVDIHSLNLLVNIFFPFISGQSIVLSGNVYKLGGCTCLHSCVR